VDGETSGVAGGLLDLHYVPAVARHGQLLLWLPVSLWKLHKKSEKVPRRLSKKNTKEKVLRHPSYLASTRQNNDEKERGAGDAPSTYLFPFLRKERRRNNNGSLVVYIFFKGWHMQFGR